MRNDEVFEALGGLLESSSVPPWERRTIWSRCTAAAGSAYIGKYINDFVYDRRAPELRNELQRLNPTLPDGGRKHKHHQWFTPEHGHPRLREHLAGVTALMRAASSWHVFCRSLDRAYPKFGVNDSVEPR